MRRLTLGWLIVTTRWARFRLARCRRWRRRRRAEEAATKALELDRALAEAHSALGLCEALQLELDAQQSRISNAPSS